MATTIPNENDVLFGRGFTIITHSGNQRFRAMVDAQKAEFASAGRGQGRKRAIALNIMNNIHSLQPPGRFLMEDPDCKIQGSRGAEANSKGTAAIMDKVWVCVEPEKALAKVLHRLREKERRASHDSNPILGQRRDSLPSTETLSPGSNGVDFSDATCPQVRESLVTGLNLTEPLPGSPSHQYYSDSRLQQTALNYSKTQNETPREVTTRWPATSQNSSPCNFDHGNEEMLSSWSSISTEQEDDKEDDEWDTFLKKSLKDMGRKVPKDDMVSFKLQDSTREDLLGQDTKVKRTLLEAVNLKQQDSTRKDTTEDNTVAPLSNSATSLLDCKKPIQSSREGIELHGKLPQVQFGSGKNQDDQAQAQARLVSDNLEFDSLIEGGRGGGELNSYLGDNVSDIEMLLQELSSSKQTTEANKEMTQELTLPEWIEQSKKLAKLEYGTADVPEKLSLDQVIPPSYIRSALHVALRLAECLNEAESNKNPIPRECIVAQNVSIRLKGPEHVLEGLAADYIQEVTFVKPVGDCSSGAETIMSRLYALAFVLYELFSTEEQSMEIGITSTGVSSPFLSINSMNLNDVSGNRPQKRHSLNLVDKNSGHIGRLEMKGLPWSLIELLNNLFDCGKGDFCGDDAYVHFADLQSDLKLMAGNPSWYVNNIQTIPMPDLEISNDKLYGRESEIALIEEAYQQHTIRGFGGLIIKGSAGVGKSKLAMNVAQKLSDRSNSYFVVAKFDQNKNLKPLYTIGKLFDSLCEMLSKDLTLAQLNSIEKALERALSSQVDLLAGAVPQLSKLIPSCGRLETNHACVDAAVSIRYLFGELLSVISSYSRRPISLFLDDVQFADQTSLLLVGNLLSVAQLQGSSDSPIFFTFCCRDEEVNKNGPFNEWLSSISIFSLEAIQLGNMTPESVNKLVSETLHLSPRITRQLSSVLHHKSSGNPLFLKQLMVSLKEQGYIYVKLSKPRWDWRPIDRIMELEISDDVISLLMKEMQRLPSDLQMGLKIASCIGGNVTYTILDILSDDLGLDLLNILEQVSQKGFMNHILGSKKFTWSHDKIQQAAYEMQPEEERRKNQLRYGLAICAKTLGNIADSDELFFIAVHLINRGGPGVVSDTNQKKVIAGLNLKAGRLIINLSGHSAALRLFEHGISFLRSSSDHWTTCYKLSIDLFQAAAESACNVNSASVTTYAQEVDAHATCLEDKLTCLYCATKSLRNADLLRESMQSSFEILLSMGEELPRGMGDVALKEDIKSMNSILQDKTDESIFNMEESNDKRMGILLKILDNLANLLHFVEPSLIGGVSLRMVELTITGGLSARSPMAFSYYGEVLVASGYISEGCRAGRLALKLLEKEVSSTYKSSVICAVYQTVLWPSEPLQSIVDAHWLGLKAGQLSGDFLYAALNWFLALSTSYVTGKSLISLQNKIRQFIEEYRQKIPILSGFSNLLYLQVAVLRYGLDIWDNGVDNIPTEKVFLATAGNRSVAMIELVSKIHRLMRAFLFRKLNGLSSDDINIMEVFSEQRHFLRPLYLMGVFFEGLISFYLARQANGETKDEWIKRGDIILENMRRWSEHSLWNWENKMLILEAEKMYSIGELGRAGPLYISAIRSSRNHKFLHEEAIGCELAGVFFLERGLQNSCEFFMHAVKSYNEWGANAVAERVETMISSKFGSDMPNIGYFASLFGSDFLACEGSTKKRQLKD